MWQQEDWIRGSASQAEVDRRRKYEIWLGLVTGESSQNEATEHYGADRITGLIATIVRRRRLANDAVLEALANTEPGRPTGSMAVLAAARK